MAEVNPKINIQPMAIDPNLAKRTKQELALQKTISNIKHTIAIQS